MIKFTSNSNYSFMNESLKVRNATKQDVMYMGLEETLPSGKPTQWAEWVGKDEANILVICGQSNMDEMIFVTVDLFDGESDADDAPQYACEFELNEENKALKKFNDVVKLLSKNPEKYAYGAGSKDLIKLGFYRNN